ncbi:hypothetical protein [Methylovulum miyakonense]|uniref:hypothetical protein n=1 Tax=Methylovulum miyakonense TaxID=645578 RepID=UPI000371349B|nr:hypothetical protein [Methylovulum miyakonense]
MKASSHLLIIGILTTLAACSTQETKQDLNGAKNVGPQQAAPATPDTPQASGQNPAMTLTKAGKKLNLVRIMDGAACKNDFEGVKGSFLLYADPSDIERIKREKGAKIFGDFEAKIQTFSEEVLQQAVNATTLAEDPFALGKDEAREKLARQLSLNFQKAAVAAIANFEKETTLSIDIAAFPPSLIFYQQGCVAALDEPDGAETTGTKP